MCEREGFRPCNVEEDRVGLVLRRDCIDGCSGKASLSHRVRFLGEVPLPASLESAMISMSLSGINSGCGRGCDTICRPFRASGQGSWVGLVKEDGWTFEGGLGLSDGRTRCWQGKKMTSGTVSKVPFGRERHVAILLTAGAVSRFYICR